MNVRVLAMALVALLSIAGCKPGSGGQTKAVLPPSWPVKELTLPADARAYRVNPIFVNFQDQLLVDGVSQDFNRTSGKVWMVGFTTKESFDKVMAHFDSCLKQTGMLVINDRPVEDGPMGLSAGQRVYGDSQRKVFIKALWMHTPAMMERKDYEGWTLELRVTDAPYVWSRPGTPIE